MTTLGELPDIVERLRDATTKHVETLTYRDGHKEDHVWWPGTLLSEAADLIDRLRATPPGSPLIAEREAVKDLRIHRHAWRDALAELAENGVDTSVRAGDETYWQRELKVFDRVVAALTPSPSPTEREGGLKC